MPAVLIFLPIVITWYGLYHATLAYRQSRGDPDLAGKSFLEQWQTGFDQRLSERLYFDRIALWTLLGVGVLVAVSLVQAVIRRRSDRMDAHESAELMRRLAAALTAADFQLSRYRVNDASLLTLGSQQLVDAADRMVKAGETARAIQEEAHESLRETRESLNRVKKLADALLSGEKSVRDAGQQVSDAMTGVGARLDGIVAATGSVSEAAAELTRSTNADSANLRRAIQQAVTDSAAEIRTAVGESQRKLGTRIGGALDSSGANIRQALDDWRIEGQIYSHRHETTADGADIQESELTIGDKLGDGGQGVVNELLGPALRELQYLLYEPKPMWGDIVQPDATGRLEIVRRVAALFFLLHSKNLVIGDVSSMNLLWSPSPAGIFLLDCDGVRAAGSPAVLKQANTPDWNDPNQPAGGPDLDTDRYKLALLVARVLTKTPALRPGQPLRFVPGLPERIVTAVTARFDEAGGPRGVRPDAGQWVRALDDRDSIDLPPLPPVRTLPSLPKAPMEGQRGQRPMTPLPPPSASA